MFPRLKERRTQVAGTLSGGEQQMLAMARALMALQLVQRTNYCGIANVVYHEQGEPELATN